jgi:hypothetical protein
MLATITPTALATTFRNMVNRRNVHYNVRQGKHPEREESR